MSYISSNEKCIGQEIKSIGYQIYDDQFLNRIGAAPPEAWNKPQNPIELQARRVVLNKNDLVFFSPNGNPYIHSSRNSVGEFIFTLIDMLYTFYLYDL